MDWDFSAAFEYDPDDPPEVISFSFRLGATNEADFECEVMLQQQGVCGTGYYDQRDATTSTELVIMDCSGVEDEYEDTVNKEVNGCTMCLVYVDKCEEGETGLGQETPRWPNGYRYRWTLSNPKPLHHVPVKGALGMFQVPFNIVVLNEMETCND